MIVDAHTHVFPPHVAAQRTSLARREPAFGALYASDRAKLASAEDLLASMAAAGVDQSWAMGFAWTSPSECHRHNEYLVEWATRAPDRFVAFAALQPADPATAVAEIAWLAERNVLGIGELRPEDQGYNLADPEVGRVFEAARDAGMVVLLHVSEPVGHSYPGKTGLALREFVEFAAWYSPGRTIAAHWGGGLPFYLLMPEVREALANTWFDSAASSLLYEPSVFEVVAGLAGSDRVLFASDYPLLGQARQVERVREAVPPALQEAVLGGNAAALLPSPLPAGAGG
jgi:predicted TIM-barrel fold metal-dependent hydrolase